MCNMKLLYCSKNKKEGRIVHMSGIENMKIKEIKVIKSEDDVKKMYITFFKKDLIYFISL